MKKHFFLLTMFADEKDLVYPNLKIEGRSEVVRMLSVDEFLNEQ